MHKIRDAIIALAGLIILDWDKNLDIEIVYNHKNKQNIRKKNIQNRVWENIYFMLLKDSFTFMVSAISTFLTRKKRRITIKFQFAWEIIVMHLWYYMWIIFSHCGLNSFIQWLLPLADRFSSRIPNYMTTLRLLLKCWLNLDLSN